MRHRPILTLMAFAATSTLVGCGSKPKPEEPAPVATYTPAPARPVETTPTESEAMRRRAQLEERIHFGFDQADLTPAAQRILDAKAELLRQEPGLSLRIEGHADERGSDEYNLALGNRRAAAAKRFLLQRGINPNQLATASYGEEQPADAGRGESAWAANRRDEFRITAGVSAR